MCSASSSPACTRRPGAGLLRCGIMMGRGGAGDVLKAHFATACLQLPTCNTARLPESEWLAGILQAPLRPAAATPAASSSHLLPVQASFRASASTSTRAGPSA